MTWHLALTIPFAASAVAAAWLFITGAPKPLTQADIEDFDRNYSLRRAQNRTVTLYVDGVMVAGGLMLIAAAMAGGR